jgi:hypothetical protein
MIKVGWMGVVGGGREKRRSILLDGQQLAIITRGKKVGLYFMSLSFAIFLSTEL